MKSRNSHNYPASNTQREIRLIELRNISAKGNSTLNHFGAGYSKLIELARQNFFKARRSYRKDL